MGPTWFYGEGAVLAFPPLIPIWYWGYKKHRKEEEQKGMEAVVWELKDQLKELKEQLSRRVITQEEYEQKKKKLLEKYQAR